MSGLGDAVEDLRAATCRLGRELFRPVGPDYEDGDGGDSDDDDRDYEIPAE